MKDKSEAKKIVSLDGLDIYYWVTWFKGAPNNFKVLHPGSSMNHSSLEELEKGLNFMSYPTIVFDPRGAGHSDAPTEPEFYTLERYSNDLQRLVAQEGLENPSLIGHSSGFMPIVDYVSRTSNAEQITGICSSYKFSETTGNKALFHLFNKVLRCTEYFGSLMTNIGHKLKGKKRGYPDQSGLKSDLAVWLSIVDVPFKNIKAHTVSGIEINKWDISSQLQNIDKPMLLVYGTKDSMVKPYAGERIKDLVKGDCRIEMVKGTHSLPVTRPEKILSVLEKYV